MNASKSVSTSSVAVRVGYVLPSMRRLTRKSLRTSPPRAGMTLLKPYDAMYAPQMRRNRIGSVGYAAWSVWKNARARSVR